MESKRFDRMAKSLASWSSRRRFLGGISGAAAGALATRSHLAGAQDATPPPAAGECVITPPPSLEDADQIPGIAKDALSKIPVASSFAPKMQNPDEPIFANKIRFDYLVDAVRCVLSQTGNANGGQVLPLAVQLRGLFHSFATGYVSVRLPEGSVPIPPTNATPGAEARSSIDKRAFAQTTVTPESTPFVEGDATTPELPCGGLQCVVDFLSVAGQCQWACQTIACETKCYTDFFVNLTSVPVTPDGESCLGTMNEVCAPDCCLSRCCPPGC